ncbi:MAG: GNAT family N-acetyltransferase [Dehalococcoidia bacterium]
MRPRAWQAMVETPDAVHVADEDGEMLLVPEQGQLRLYWAYADTESMRFLFPAHFADVRDHIDADRAEHVSMDLVGFVNRNWLNPLLKDADFEFFAEWMEMVQPDLDPANVPEFPEGVRMRRAEDGDVDRLREIWLDAYGEYHEGERAFDAMVEQAEWGGVLEVNGEVAGFALNSGVERAEGRILTAAVAPEHWGNGYGRLVLAAAAYQLASREAVRAVVKVRPDIKQALRTCADLGFRHLRSGLEYRRSLDEAALDQKHEERRIGGVKARFGNWR